MASSLLIFLYFFDILVSIVIADVTYPTLYVDQNGKGGFSSIQAAINHVPSNNNKWIRIYVKAGVYREQVNIPVDKQFIYIQGEGSWNTKVEWNASDSIASDATFSSHADNILVKDIAFVNTYNYPPGSSSNKVKAALAAMISGDKSTFKNVAFLGFQDTLWDDHGRHYFYECTIRGAIDFIFGAGQSLYERCTISVVAKILSPTPGVITAQARSDPKDTNGFVFKYCNVTGNGNTYLGRPWRDYARVYFIYTSMQNIIVPDGWLPWKNVGHENQLSFGEYGCEGQGANTAQRVPWEQKLTREVANRFASISFVDQEGWIYHQPK